MLDKIIPNVASFLKHNSATILMILGSIGVVATTAVTIKSTIKMVRRLDKQEEPLTKPEIIKKAIPIYIPTLILGVATISCIVGANALNKRQQASLASAYLFVETAFKQYKGKVKELFGEEADTQVREAIVKDQYKEYKKYRKKYPDNGDPSFTEKQLFFEEHYGYFERSKEDVLNAQYQLNRKFANEGIVLLNDFYEMLGLKAPEGDDLLGWSAGAAYMYDYFWIDFSHEIVKMEDGMECCIITILTPPMLDY